MKRRSIAEKIWSVLIILMIGYAGSIVFVYWNGFTLERRIGSVSRVWFAAADLSQEALSAFTVATRLYTNAGLLEDPAELARARESGASAISALGAIGDFPDLPPETRDRIETLLAEAEEISQRMDATYSALIAAAGGESGGASLEELNQRAFDLAGPLGRFREQLVDLKEDLTRSLNEALDAITRDSRSQRRWNLGIGLGFLLFTISTIWWIMNDKVMKPIFQIIGQLKRSSTHISESSGAISNAGQSLAQGSSMQASSLEETSAALEEISAATRQNADNAEKINAFMTENQQIVGRCERMMNDLTHAMDEIFQASGDISKIVQTIDEIAFQTNLLALNAAVESARAGEAGTGFAVVAEEVRNLAMRSAEAARNTGVLIEQTVEKIADGSDIVVNTDGAFKDVSANSGRMVEVIRQIADASNEQARSIEQINASVAEIDRITRKNADDAQNMASSTDQMLHQADRLKEVVTMLMSLAGKNAR